jgi:Flp pilus assembly protein TadD
MLDTGTIPPHLAPARAALDRRDYKGAIAAADAVLRMRPDDIDLLGIRYAAQAEMGDLKGAIETLRRLLDKRPDAIAAINDLALFLSMTGERLEADTVARHALRMAPLDPQAHNMLGMLLAEQNDLVASEWHYRRAIELAGRQGKLIANLALNLMQQGRTEESDPLFAEADGLEANNPATLTNWARLCEVMGDTVRAHALIDRAEKAARSSGGDVSLARAMVLSRENKHEEAVATLTAARHAGRETELPASKQLERGRLYDKLGRYDEAWADFVEAKARFRDQAGFKYDTANVDMLLKRMRFFFNRNHMSIMPRAKPRPGMPQPIFILGFPRSGTTMIEQVITSHSAVQAGDELAFIPELTQLAQRLLGSPYDFPEALSDVWAADKRYAIETFRDIYMTRVAQLGLLESGRPFFTDKLPLNETFLPFIHLLFPEAKFVHLIRHPLDIGVSVMSNYLTHGFFCGFALDSFAHHYMSIHDLVAHYRQQMDLPYYALRYESFVANQEEETRKLLDFLELPFEDGTIAFHENQRYARTASYVQVKQKLYTGSVHRYMHYRRHLEPVVPTLKRAIDALGYTVES